MSTRAPKLPFTYGPDDLIRQRDSIYTTDLLVVAIGHLDFFSRIGESPSNIVAIRNKFQIKDRPADVMLTLFKSMGLIELKKDIYHLTDVARDYLTTKSPQSLVPYFSTLTERAEVSKMLEVLRTGKPAGWSHKKGEELVLAMENDEFAERFTSGMDSRGSYFAPGLTSAFDFSKFRSVLDIAGGSGKYAITIKEKFPGIRAGLLEKSPVDKVVRRMLKKKGLSSFIEVYEGDMFQSEFPIGFDIHLYSHVIHDWDIDEIRILAGKSRESLNPGGMIMIHDTHLDKDKRGPLSVAEYSVLVMFATPGKCYSVGEMEEILTSEGFKNIRYKPTIWNRSIITGIKD
ncbi:MAG TPA: methyltransferase [Cyclobacteriaceae bacterium]|nr:methyltransferase [Cyclobacteriaceae bacterium]